MGNYIERLYAKDTGVFNELSIKFNRRFNFIVGPNGSGKTSILRCIALALNPSNSNNMRCKDSSEVWFDAILGEMRYRVGLGKGWVANAEEYRGGTHKSWRKPPQGESGITPITVHDLENENLNISPLILGAYRRIEYKKIEGMLREPNLIEQRMTYHNSGFNNIDGGSLPNVKQWMINRYFQIDKEWAKAYKKNWQWVIDNINKLSPSNCELCFKEIKRDLEPIFTLNGLDCYLEEISAGFQSFLSVIFAIVEWIECTNEEVTSYVPNAEGTVIIDELDAHLHPEWQFSIRESLASFFPKLQFITTTHSPHLISSAEFGEIIIIPELCKDMRLVPTEKTYSGWNTDQILEDVMGVESLENKLYAIKLNEAMDCVSRNDSVGLQSAINNLSNIVHPSNTVLQVLQMKLAALALEDSDDKNK